PIESGEDVANAELVVVVEASVARVRPGIPGCAVVRALSRTEVRGITDIGLSVLARLPTRKAGAGDKLPGCRAAGSDGIPNRRVVIEVVAEVCTSTSLVEDGNSEMNIQVGEIDGIRATSEGTEGRSAGLHLSVKLNNRE